jgi:sugar fermentation stimulation protein A
MELTEVVAKGGRAMMLYVVQRSDCRAFSIASDIDPAYAKAFVIAKSKGVKMICYVCTIRRDGIQLRAPLPMAEG